MLLIEALLLGGLELAGFDGALPELLAFHAHHADVEGAVLFGAGEVEQGEVALEGAAARLAEEVELVLIVFRIGGEWAECEVEEVVAVGVHEARELAVVFAATDKEEAGDALIAEHLQQVVVLAFGVAEVVAIVGRVEDRCAGDDDFKGRGAVDDFLTQPLDLLLAEHLREAVAAWCVVAVAAGVEHEEVDVGAAEACGDAVEAGHFDGLWPIGFEAVFGMCAVGVVFAGVFGAVVVTAPGAVVWDAGEEGLQLGEVSGCGEAFEGAALGGPVALAQVGGVAGPDHELGLFVENGGEDAVAAAENLVRGLEAVFGDVVRATHCDAQIGRWGAVEVVGRGLERVLLFGELAVELDAVVVFFAGLDCVECECRGVIQGVVSLDCVAPTQSIGLSLLGIGDAHFGGGIGLHPDGGFAHVDVAEHGAGCDVGLKVSTRGEEGEGEECSEVSGRWKHYKW